MGEGDINLKKGKPPSRKKGEGIKRIHILYALLVISALLYILSSNTAFGVLAFLLVIVILAAEFGSSVKSIGVSKTARDVIISVIAAVLLFWAIPSILLRTSSPVNVVVSCSMLPSMHRGDLVILHGIGSMRSFLASHDIPTLNISSAAFNSMLFNISSEFLEPYAYAHENASEILPYASNLAGYSIGYYNAVCLERYYNAGEPSYYYRCLVPEAAQQRNLISYSYAIGNEMFPGAQVEVPYTYSISINGISIRQNYSNPIIVYRASADDNFKGDVIHRLYAALNVDGRYYLLTKGDNNAVLDIEAMNYPINQDAVIGYVVADIPFLGYPSLIVRGQVGSVPGCNQTLLR